MNNGKNLRILISASLNKGLSIGEINKSIKEISKHPSLQKIKVKLDIDSKILQTISDFSKTINQISQATQVQNKSINESTKALNQETSAINEQVSAQKKLNAEKQKIVKDAQGNIKSESYTYGNNLNNDKRTINTKHLSDGVFIQNTVFTSNQKKDFLDYNKMLNEAYKMNEAFNKKSEALDRAHYEALKSNKSRFEAMDKMHYMALKKNRELDVANRAKAVKEAETIDRAHYSALKTNQQRKEAMDKMHYLALQQNKQRDVANSQKLLSMQRAAELQVMNLTRRHGNNIDTVGLNSLLTQINALTPRMNNFRAEALRLTNEISKIGASAEKTSRSTFSLGAAFQTAFAKMGIWLTAGTFFFGTQRIIKDLTQTVIELDTQMTELKRVMSEDTNFNQFMQQSISLSTELSQKVTEVNKAMIGFARQGFDAGETTQLAKAAILAANVSQLGSEEAMQNLTSTIIQFKMEARDAIGIIDRLNEVDNNYAITTKDLSNAIAKSGSVAKTFGVTLEELIGYSTAIGAATKESGNIVGNSLKTMISRVTTLKGSVNALNEIGINVFDPLTNQSRNVSDVLSELSKKWGDLSKTQKENISVQIAGRYHLSRFNALMNNFKMAQDATKTALNSSGSATRENIKYQESLQAQINKLIASYQELAYVIGEGGLKKSLSVVLSAITSVIVGFTDMTKATDGWNMKLPLIVAGVWGLVKAFQVLSKVATVAKFSMGWIGLAFVGIELIASAFIGASKNTEINTDALINNANETKRNAQEIEALIEKHKKLKPEAINSTKKQEELNDVLRQINDIAPHLIENTNSYGDALSLNEEKAAKYVSTLKEMSQEQLEQARLANEIQLNKINSEIEKADNELSKFGGNVKEKFSKLNIYQEIFDAKTFEKGLENYRSMVTKITKESEERFKNGDNSAQLTAEKEIRQLQADFMEFTNLIKSSQKELSDYAERVNNRNGANQQKEILLENKKLIEEQITGRRALNSTIKDSTIYYDEETEAMLASQSSTEESIDSTNKFSQSLNTLDEKISGLATAYQKLQEGEQLTVAETMNLIEKHPQLLDYLSKHNGLIQDKGAILQQIANIENKTYLDQQKRLLDDVNNTYNALEAKRKMYEQFYNKVNPIAGMDAIVEKYGGKTKNDPYDFFKESGLTPEEDDALKNAAKRKKELEILVNLLSKPIDLAAYSKSSTATSPKEKSDIQSSLHELTDFSREEINNINNVIKAREHNIKSLEKQIQTASKIDDHSKTILLTNELLTEQNGKLKDIETANSLLNKSANSVRDTYSQIAGKFSDNGVGFDVWFNDDATASETYIKAIQDIDREMQEIEGSGFNLSDKQKTAIKNLENQKSLYENIFKQIQSIKQAWSANVDEIQKVTDTVESLSQNVVESKFDFSKNWIDDQKNTGKLSLEEELAAWKRVYENHKDNEHELQVIRDANYLKRREAERQIYSLEQELYKKRQDNAKELAKNAIELQKKIFEAQREVELKGIEKVIDAENERHKKRMDHLSDEMDKYQESIDIIRKSMNRESDEEDYNKELAKSQKEAQDIQNKVNLYKLDNSIEGQSKLAELEKEYADKIEAIEKFKSDRTKKLRENNLDDLLESKKKEIDTTKKSEDTQHDINKKNLDAMKESRENYWKGIIENDATYLKIEQDIMEGHLDAVLANFGQFANGIKGFAQMMGEELNKNLNQNIANVINQIGGYKSNPTAPTQQSTPYSASELEVIRKMKINSDAWHNPYNSNPRDRKILEDANKELGASIGAVYRNGTWYKNDVPLYHVGGEVGVEGTTQEKWWDKLLKSNETPAILKRGEVVLSQPMDFINQMASRMMSNFNSVSKPAAMTTSTGHNYYNIDINIDKLMGGKQGAQTLFTEIKKSIQLGKR